MATKFGTAINLLQNPLQNAKIDNLSGAPGSPVNGQVYYDTTKNQLGCYCNGTWIYLAAAGTGTVTSVSVASANGFAGTVATSTTTPAITISTSVTGLLKGNGTAVSAAVSATDYAPATTGSSILKASSGGFASAVSGTDYAPATSGTSILKGNGSGGFSNAVSNTDYAPVASPTFTGTVTVPSTVNSTDAAQKAYVDAAVQGISAKYSARYATVGTETFTISSGNVTQIAGTVLDGGSPSVGDYVLIKDAPASTGAGSAMSLEPGNGLYSVTSNTTNLSVSRVADFSGSSNPAGAYVFTEAGTVNASAGYIVTSPSSAAAFTYGTNNIQFTQFTGAGEVTAGTGLTKSGNTLSLTTPVTIANGGTGASSTAQNNVFAGPTSGSGAPSFRALVAADVPTLNQSTTGNAANVTGIVAIANGGTGASSVAGAKTAFSFGQVYTTGTIGDGSSTTLTVTHNLGNQYPHVTVYDLSGSHPQIMYCDVIATSTNVVTLTFGTAPAASSVVCSVMG